jgi:hypothetical protein
MFRLARVQAHLHLIRADVAPVFGRQRPLPRERRSHCIARSHEDDEQAVAFTAAPHDAAVAAFKGCRQQGIVPGHDLAHGLRVLLPQAGTALHVRKEEGQRARR